jgi:AcrR family transcriptional regulator
MWSPQNDLADRIAGRTLAKRGADHASEVRRLLDAGLEVMRRCGTASRPRVADIVAAAGLSNDAFYRHFPSKDALVAAILQDGAERLAAHLARRMADERGPEGRVRRWIEGVFAQADAEIARTTLAVLWNAGSVSEESAAGRLSAVTPLVTLLVEPFAALGSIDPDLDASLAAHATLGKLSDYLWDGAQPTRAEVEEITGFCLAAITRRASGRARKT